ncbi:sulfate ABC transporter substrate-binding protein [Heliorestis acidaminivorans]|uniref:Sulfate ABC transporter substrate-binding protein n=2 Tax=Heliorestis acidaminivorans TaxID=553427 RepID=A0A6I0F402_9FIRM|nr:sulfate ABC transporter substrate-binding protein [Heliorestis acidaminivorans]
MPSPQVSGIILLIMLSFIVTACTPGMLGLGKREDYTREAVLTISAYSVTKEALEREIIPAFQEKWEREQGEPVIIRQTYGPSGAQARAIAGGLRADIALLALESDMNLIAREGLITEPWKEKKHGGQVTRSIVTFGVRPGNPLAIEDWPDLMHEGIEIIYPSPRTSGGAMWVINAIYGSALKESEKVDYKNHQGLDNQLKLDSQKQEKGRERLKRIQSNVRVMDKSARESMTTFEKGLGQVIITYENELLLRNREEKIYEIIYPYSTILIENPVALIDKNVERNGNRKIAEAFLDYLWSREAQEIFANYGFRPVHEEVMAERIDQFPQPEGLFDIDYLGGWDEVRVNLYGPQGLWTQVIEGREQG